MKKDIINALSQVELHDLPVVKLSLFFEEKKVVIEVEENADNEYIRLLLIFKDVTNLFTNNPISVDFTDASVLTLECKHINNDKYEARFVLEMGHSNPIFIITIEFADIEIERQRV